MTIQERIDIFLIGANPKDCDSMIQALYREIDKVQKRKIQIMDDVIEKVMKRPMTPDEAFPSLVKDTYLFLNGNVCTCDDKGEQIPELQGRYTKELHQKILDRSDSQTRINGFPELNNNGVSHSVIEEYKDKIILNRVEHTNQTPNEDLLKSLIGECSVAMPINTGTKFELRIDKYTNNEIRVTVIAQRKGEDKVIAFMLSHHVANESKLSLVRELLCRNMIIEIMKHGMVIAASDSILRQKEKDK